MKNVLTWLKFNESLREYIEIGPCPAEEDAVQVSTKVDYYNAMIEQCRKYKRMLILKFPSCDKVELSIKINNHDFGKYAEVVAYYNDEIGEEQAIFIQNNAPEKWSDTEPIQFTQEEENFDEDEDDQFLSDHGYNEKLKNEDQESIDIDNELKDIHKEIKKYEYTKTKTKEQQKKKDKFGDEIENDIKSVKKKINKLK